MAITPSYLREHLYTILDEAAETGTSPEIVLRKKGKKGRTLRIVADRKPDIFDRLEPHPNILLVDPEEIVHMDWSHYWHNDLP